MLAPTEFARFNPRTPLTDELRKTHVEKAFLLFSSMFERVTRLESGGIPEDERNAERTALQNLDQQFRDELRQAIHMMKDIASGPGLTREDRA